MLEYDCARSLEYWDAFESLWAQLGCCVELPQSVAAFLARRGRRPLAYDDRRRFPRTLFGGRAILLTERECHAVYTVDMSRDGIAFYHFMELLPCLPAELFLGDGTITRISIRRCRRIASLCYTCGACIEAVRQEPSDETLRRIATAAGLVPRQV